MAVLTIGRHLPSLLGFHGYRRLAGRRRANGSLLGGTQCD